MTLYQPNFAVPQRHRLNVEQFMLLDDHGAFDNVRKSELLDGEVFVMNAQYRRHLMVKSDLLIALHFKLDEIGSACRALSEGSVHISDVDLPEPDILVTSDPYGTGPVPGSSIALLVEVSDSTQDVDFGKKAMIYARAAVPEYWVLDTQACIAHQHWAPEGIAYTQRREIPLGRSITAETIAGLTVTLPE
jgi:Uma2 family endonuclease